MDCQRQTFLQEEMWGVQVVVGAPPSAEMDDILMATPFGIVMGGRETTERKPALSEPEVKLAYRFGVWTSQVARMLHDAGEISVQTADQQA